MDGARIFNAATALGYDLNTIGDYLENVDSINICFSKGLHCPVGSIIVGNDDFIDMARRYRKALGGGMRQAGVLAAAALVSLDEIVPNLDKSHKCARYMHDELVKLDVNGMNMIEPETNVLMFTIDNDFPFTDKEFAKMLKDDNILIHHWSKNVFRLVFYNAISMEDVEIVLDKFKSVFDMKMT